MESTTLGRTELYRGWYEWALLTLGHDAALATLAATAAWLVLHLVAVQVPILVLLLATPSRRHAQAGSVPDQAT